MGHLGFSYIGVIYLMMLFISNIIWAKHMPSGYESGQENKIMVMFERIGQVCVCACAVMFSDFNLHAFNLHSLWLVASFLCMVLYEGYWIRYFRSQKQLSDMYCSFCGIPLAGAVLPVMGFFLLGIYGKVVWMLISVILLGIGHIQIHYAHAKELT